MQHWNLVLVLLYIIHVTVYYMSSVITHVWIVVTRLAVLTLFRCCFTHLNNYEEVIYTSIKGLYTHVHVRLTNYPTYSMCK